MMPFTAEEVWSALPARETSSVHLAAFPVADEKLRDKGLEARWEKLMEVRRLASLELEKARQTGQIGKSLEAQVEIEPDTDATGKMLRELGPLLESVLIVSQARVGQLTGGQLRAKVMAAEGYQMRSLLAVDKGRRREWEASRIVRAMRRGDRTHHGPKAGGD